VRANARYAPRAREKVVEAALEKIGDEASQDAFLEDVAALVAI
jgi:hypothetical protein